LFRLTASPLYLSRSQAFVTPGTVPVDEYCHITQFVHGLGTDGQRTP
jgi:hypothetical protein